ncbi:MAG: hypothetical protein ACK4TO_01430 [Candidatus Nitrosotenuis sp.]
MNSKLIFGATIAALIAVTLTSTYAISPAYFDITAAASDGTTHSMTLADKVKQIPANRAEDIVSFWAWAIPIPAGAPAGTVLAVEAITIHHGVNDHQEFGKAAQSSPVQSFHPHKAYFDGAFCVIGLESPKASFKVQHDTITLAASNIAAFSATGTIGPRSDCLATGLGIRELVDTQAIPGSVASAELR